MANMQVWAFLYNSCIYESSWATVSLHFSKEGAEKAMAWHKEDERKKWEEMHGDDEEFKQMCPFGFSESWDVAPMEVLH